MVKYAKFEFAKRHKRINKIMNFFTSLMLVTLSKRSFAKFKLAKFNGQIIKFCLSFKRNKIEI
ncbi:hypothetical protein DMC01_07870 [Campylobacter troglodytis]|nr:hypothetical protein DMC01_07870 [Campylobacter troglodytis]